MYIYIFFILTFKHIHIGLNIMFFVINSQIYKHFFFKNFEIYVYIYLQLRGLVSVRSHDFMETCSVLFLKHYSTSPSQRRLSWCLGCKDLVLIIRPWVNPLKVLQLQMYGTMETYMADCMVKWDIKKIFSRTVYPSQREEVSVWYVLKRTHTFHITRG